jgi:hypothetical protein
MHHLVWRTLLLRAFAIGFFLALNKVQRSESNMHAHSEMLQVNQAQKKLISELERTALVG